jgi:hypothetical protein
MTFLERYTPPFPDSPYPSNVVADKTPEPGQRRGKVLQSDDGLGSRASSGAMAVWY